MNLEKMKSGVLANLLTREEMKLVVAGSGPPDPGCGVCQWQDSGVFLACTTQPGIGCFGCGTYC